MDSNRFWTKQDREQVKNAVSFLTLSQVAIRVLRRIIKKMDTDPKYAHKTIVVVCGPITSGGTGSIDGNIKVFRHTIDRLSEEGYIVFNQLRFERPMWKIKKLMSGRKKYKDSILLRQFYAPVFILLAVLLGVKKKYKLCFIHGWKSSFGAKWERKLNKLLGATIEDLPKGF